MTKPGGNPNNIPYISYRYGELAPYRSELQNLLSKVPESMGSAERPFKYQDTQLAYKKNGAWYIKSPKSNFIPDRYIVVTDHSRSIAMDFGYLVSKGIKIPKID